MCEHLYLQQWSNWQLGKLNGWKREGGEEVVSCCSRIDHNGRNGLQYVLEVILHLLDPTLPEFSASYVGKLVVVFIQKVTYLCAVTLVWTIVSPQAGNALGHDLQLLLRAVLSKMQGVTTSSVMQSLLLVFARLLHTEVSCTC